MSPDNIIRELASELRDVIREYPDIYLDEDPEDLFVDLACRLVVRLSRKEITVIPSPRFGHDEAARRIFEIFTRWLNERSECAYTVQRGPSGFELLVKTPKETLIFRGDSVQDASAQAAQTINFSGGSL